MEENKKKLGQEPAFSNEYHQGMSTRFYAACMAMQGLLSKHGEYSNSNMLGLTPEEAIRKSFLFADELLRQEEL